MPAEKRKKPGMRLTVVIDADLGQRMKEFVYEARATLSGFVQDAVAVRLARVETPADYVERKRARTDRTVKPLFDLGKVDAFGWPHAAPKWYEGTKREFRLRLSSDGAPALQAQLVAAWAKHGVGEFTEAHFAETLRQLAGRAGKGAAAPVNLGKPADPEADALDAELRAKGWEM
jgi:hypothetical protein